MCWGIVILFPLCFIEHTGNVNQDLGHYMRMFGVQLTYILPFYINYFFFIPRCLFKDKTTAFYTFNIFIIAVSFVLMLLWQYSCVFLFPDSFHEHFGGGHPPRWPMYFQYVISSILFIGLSVALRMSQRWVKSDEARREAEKSRAEAELKNLRNQLNPHFLLNTLNNIYALIAFDTTKAQQVVEELSRLLRHVLYEDQQNFVPLHREVEFMGNYIELMRIRVTDNVTINTDFDIPSDDATPIAPLIFISLIENAFKHGISPSRPSHINILMSEVGGDITCEIRNSNFPKSHNDKSGSGIGLEQVGKRLELMYPNHYSWEEGISEDGKEYFSKIVIYHDTELCHSR
jgi:two-component sensor histidine kinase